MGTLCPGPPSSFGSTHLFGGHRIASSLMLGTLHPVDPTGNSKPKPPRPDLVLSGASIGVVGGCMQVWKLLTGQGPLNRTPDCRISRMPMIQMMRTPKKTQS